MYLSVVAIKKSTLGTALKVKKLLKGRPEFLDSVLLCMVKCMKLVRNMGISFAKE